MKKLIVLAASVLLFGACATMAQEKSAGDTPGEMPTLILGIAGLPRNDAANLKTMTRDVIRSLADELGFGVELKYYLDDDVLRKDIREESIDFFWHFNYYFLAEYLKSEKYRPFLSFGAFKSKYLQMCFFVKKDSAYSDIESLRGADGITYVFDYEYYILRRFLGESPEDFFGSIKAAPDGVSILYSLGMDVADTAFGYSFYEDFMKITNPGPITDIKRLECTEKMRYSPVFYSTKRVSAETLDILNKTMMNFKKDPAFKRYLPLITSFGMGPVAVEAADYQYILDIYAEAGEKGWDRDFERWEKMVKENE